MSGWCKNDRDGAVISGRGGGADVGGSDLRRSGVIDRQVWDWKVEMVMEFEVVVWWLRGWGGQCVWKRRRRSVNFCVIRCKNRRDVILIAYMDRLSKLKYKTFQENQNKFCYMIRIKIHKSRFKR